MDSVLLNVFLLQAEQRTLQPLFRWTNAADHFRIFIHLSMTSMNICLLRWRGAEGLISKVFIDLTNLFVNGDCVYLGFHFIVRSIDHALWDKNNDD